MKRILIVLVLGIALLGACAGPSASPKPTPTPPAPSPSPEPTPTPTPAPEPPHYKITLLRFEGSMEGPGSIGQGEGIAHFQGEVRNDAPVTLEDMEVIITVYNKDNEPVATNRERVLEWAIPRGKASTFSISFNDYVNAAAYGISFDMPSPGILDLEAERGVLTKLRRSQLSQL